MCCVDNFFLNTWHVIQIYEDGKESGNHKIRMSILQDYFSVLFLTAFEKTSVWLSWLKIT